MAYNDAMDVDEMEIDLEVDAEPALGDDMYLDIDGDAPANGTVNDAAPLGADIAAEKVHVRGLDHLTTEDLNTFASTYYNVEAPRVEWINDTSANLVYASTSAAAAALLAFSFDNLNIPTDPIQLRAAKPLSTHPAVPLEVRLALNSDVKKAGAGVESRFYLFNPEHDPRERRRREWDTRDRRRRRTRSEEEDNKPFDENMYDDDSTSLAARIARPLPDSRRRNCSLPRTNTGKELFRDRQNRRERDDDLFTNRNANSRFNESSKGRLRDRSASPLRDDGDGRLGFSEPEIQQPAKSRSRANAIAESRAGRELFPPVLNGRANPRDRRERDDDAMDLFPDRGNTHHRRSDAFDAKDITPKGKGSDLFSRIETGRRGGLEDRISRDDEMDSSGTPGFTIRGMGVNHARVKELFPDRAPGETRRDLFDGKIKGGGTNRRRAEDLFS